MDNDATTTNEEQKQQQQDDGQQDQTVDTGLPEAQGDLVDNTLPQEDEVSNQEEQANEEEQAATDEEATNEGKSTEQDTNTSASTDTEEAETDDAGVYNSPTAADPGEFQSGDYSFTVTTTDGKTIKVSSVEEADALAKRLDNEPDLMSSSQILNFMRKTTSMEQSIERERQAWEQNKKDYDEQMAVFKAREDAAMSINNGFNYLVNKGLLPPVPKELDRADVNWSDHTDNPAIKQRLDIMKYMEDENNARIKAGIAASFDPTAAYNAMELESLRNQDKQETDQVRTAARAKGSMVGGKAPYMPSNAPKNSIVGVGKGLEDLANDLFYDQIG